MELTVESQEDSLSVVGFPRMELDVSNSLEFRRAMDPVLQSRKNVVLDMTNVSFVDSSGIGVMVYILKRLAADGKSLKLAGVTHRVRKMFCVVQMHKLFDIYEDSETATESLAVNRS